MSNGVSGLLGLAARARKITSGDTAFHQFRLHTVHLVIISEDVGNNTKKKLMDKCEFYHIQYVYMNGDVMNAAIGTGNRKFIAILDEGFAQKLHACLKG
ncbi:MAG: ribosomal L7Ae/L30e/S12e/Gadd45 family protein [Longicatena sp.]